MIVFLALLPRGLTTFLLALAALLRFYGSSNSIPIPTVPLTLLGWSLTAFLMRQRLSWLISALSGTVELEIELAKNDEIDELYYNMLASFASPNSSSSQESPAEPG